MNACNSGDTRVCAAGCMQAITRTQHAASLSAARMCVCNILQADKECAACMCICLLLRAGIFVYELTSADVSADV